MSLDFPSNPDNGDQYSDGTSVWEWDGTAWNLVGSESQLGGNKFTRLNADTGTLNADNPEDIVNIFGGTGIETSFVADTMTIDFVGATGSTQNLFETISTDDGSITATTPTDAIGIVGGTNISTEVVTDSTNVTINLDPFSINYLTDVDTISSPPTTGQVLKWNGTNWAPGSDATTGGAGTDADTLDGFDSSYFLNYNNLSNKPSILTLSSLSIGNENTPAGNGAITYDNVSGVFRFTPPTAEGLGALTSVAINDISDVSITSVADLNILQYNSSTTSWENKSITGAGFSTVSTTGSYNDLTDTPTIPADVGDLTDTGSIIPNSLLDLSISDGTNGQILSTDGEGNFSFIDAGTGGDPNQNAFTNIAVAGQTTVAADTTTDTLTISAGTGISITTDATSDTITITNTSSSNVSDFTDLGDAITSDLTIDKFYEPAIAIIRMNNVGTTAYVADTHYADQGQNPDMYALAGTTIAFDLDNIAGHPFEIQDAVGDPYNVGLLHVDNDGTVSTGNSAQGKQSGTLYWRIPESISGTYRYQCQLHAGMVGSITIKRLSVI